MKTPILLLITIFSYLCSFAQSNSAYEHGVPFYPKPVAGKHYIDIQYLELNENEFLLEEIRKYIQEQTDSSTLFRSGFGFVTVEDIMFASKNPHFMKKQLNGDHAEDIRFSLTTLSYLLTPSFVGYASYCTGCFPDFYSVIDGRLVFFYSDQSGWLNGGYFSEESKKKLIALQKPHLQQALNPNFVFTDMFGKTFTISLEERKLLTEDEIIMKASLTLQDRKTVVQYLDGRVEYRYEQTQIHRK